MTEYYDGYILEVSEFVAKSELVADQVLNDTVLTLYRTNLFPDSGSIVVLGVAYPYISKNDDLATITLGSGLTGPVPADTEVFLYPDARVKLALVQLDEEDAPDVVVPHSLIDAIDVGVRDEDDQEQVTVSMETPGSWMIENLVDEPLSRDGSYLDPDTLPPAPIIAPDPPIVPVLKLTGMPRGLMLQVENAQPSWDYLYTITDYTTEDTPDVTASYPVTKRPVFYTESMPNGTALSPASTGYSFTVTVSNSSGSSSATIGPQALVLNDDNTIAQLAVGKLVAGNLVGAFALLGALQIGANIDITPEQGIVIHTPLGDTKLPADGQSPQFTGSATFDALTLLGNLSLRGQTNEIGKGGNLELASATTPPKASPVISAAYPEHAVHGGFAPRGFAYHSSRAKWLHTESLGTAVITSTFRDSNGDYIFSFESFDLAASGGSNGGGNRPEIEGAYGLALNGDTMYVLCWTDEPQAGSYFGKVYVYQWSYVPGSTNQWSFVRRWLFDGGGRTDMGAMSANNPNICVTPAGDVFVVQSNSNNNMIGVRYSSTGVWQYTGFLRNVDDSIMNAPRHVRGLYYGPGDTGGANLLWMVLDTGGTVMTFETNEPGFTRLSAEEFPLGHSDPQALVYDTTTGHFITRSPTKVYDYSNIRTAVFSAVQTWRLANATGPAFAAGETSASPRSTTTTFPKRAWMTLRSGSAIPDDTSDPGDPNSVSFYVAVSDTSGTNSSFKRQTVPASGVVEVLLSSVPTSGAAPPLTTTGFTAGSPATISSDAADSDGPLAIMRGDGSGRMGPWKWNSSGTMTAAPSTAPPSQAGSIATGALTAATDKATVVTFPTAYATGVVPVVICNPINNSAGGGVFTAIAGNISNTGCTIYARRETGTAGFTVGWIAQPPS